MTAIIHTQYYGGPWDGKPTAIEDSALFGRLQAEMQQLSTRGFSLDRFLVSPRLMARLRGVCREECRFQGRAHRSRSLAAS